ncbi:MAG: PAS domain S-box protein [Verrucomicrobiae bacterium]|nr:PAS domain S-box protein [Verrucomicrobiae bacterium]
MSGKNPMPRRVALVFFGVFAAALAILELPHILPRAHGELPARLILPLAIAMATTAIFLFKFRRAQNTGPEHEKNDFPETAIESADQNALRKERDFIQSIFDTSQAFILVQDNTGCILRVNPHFEEISGYRADELKGNNWLDILLPAAERKRAKVIFEQVKNSAANGGTQPIVTKQGQTLMVEWFSRPLKSAGGESIGILSIGYDVTQRLRIDKQLWESKERLQLVIDGSTDGFWDYDIPHGHITHSKRYASFLGYDATEAPPTRQGWENLIHPEDKGRVIQELQDHLDGKKNIFSAEYRLRHKSGEYRWVLSRGQVMARDPEGRPLRACGTHLDITHQKLAQEALFHLASFIEQNPHPIIEIDLLGHIHYLNEAAIELLPNIKELGFKHPWLQDIKTFEGFELGKNRTLFRSIIHENRYYSQILIYAEHLGRIRMYGYDITDQKRAEQALLESERRFRVIFDRACVGMLLLNDAGQLFEANPAIEQLLGYTATELQTMVMADILHTKDRLSWSQSSLQLFAGKMDHCQSELRLIRRDNQPVWSHITATLIRKSSGKPWFCVAMVENVTQRRQAEQALLAANQFNEEIFSNAGEGIIVYDHDLRYVLWNRFMEKLSGIGFHEVLGKKAADLFPHIYGQGIVPMLKKAMQGETVHTPDIEFSIPQTRHRGWVSCTYTPHRDISGTIVGVIGLVRDIGARKKAETAILESEKRFRQLADNIRDVFWIISADSQKIIYASRAYEKIWGRSCRELQQHSVQWIAHVLPEDRMDLAAALNQAARGEEFTLEYRITHADGTLRWIRDSGFPVRGNDGGVYRIAGIASDITEQKRLQNEILQISEREQKRIGQDIHDSLLQNLVGIAFMSEVLGRKMGAKQLPEAAEITRITGLVNQALTEARGIARGLCPVELEENGLMSALQELSVATANLYGITCRFFCEEPLLIRDNAKAIHLYRIAQEAINNAIKHGQASRIDIFLEIQEKRVSLRISDNGRGIPAQPLRGQGMGLRSMSYRAKMIGGTLDASLLPGGGTKVECLFPHDNTP